MVTTITLTYSGNRVCYLAELVGRFTEHSCEAFYVISSLEDNFIFHIIIYVIDHIFAIINSAIDKPLSRLWQIGVVGVQVVQDFVGGVAGEPGEKLWGRVRGSL